MFFPSFLRIIALFALPLALAILLAGCGGHSISVYESVGGSSTDLESAKTICNARMTQTKMSTPSCGSIGIQDATPGSSAAIATALAEAACAAAAIQDRKNKSSTLFCACMVEHGWKCAGNLEFQDVNAPIPDDPDGAAPLHMVAFYDNHNAIYGLKSKGADLNIKLNDGRTPLHMAAWQNSVKSAEILIRLGADLNAPDQDGETPLHLAAREDNDDIASLLIEKDADINLASAEDWTPMHRVARHDSRKVAGLLISKGADIEARGGDYGATPLHVAALYGSAKVADVLIARGAQINAKAFDGATPLDIARAENNRDVAALLERAIRAATRTANNESGETNSADDGNSAESVFENTWRSVVVVFAGDSQGGGVVINEPNQVATNCHVVDESPGDISVYKGENRRAVRNAPYSAEIVAGDRGRDVCILSVPGLWAIPAKIRSVAELEIGEAVYAVGTPKGYDFSISNGIVSQLREATGENLPHIQTNAAISPGSSGGGLFDSEGRLVGLTTSKFLEGENLNFAVPVDWALELAR